MFIVIRSARSARAEFSQRENFHLSARYASALIFLPEFLVEFSYRAPTLLRVSASTFVHQRRVTYADCTVGNHIYYGRYLDILEVARGELFRALGAPFLQFQEQGIIFPVIEVRLRYKAPARYDDVLNIEVWPTAAERVRLNFAYRITNQNDALILEGETFQVCTSIEDKLQRLPKELAAALLPYLRNA